ncbi:unnamed protein product [Oppiella nova]|uniref:Carboxylesterase type B domain-containing protein n=1 Tax=Oppiella nova TaxID=334625 RepID=A0A7R9MCW7_9ACAR|nr:unnamed protein product [Oppiella nova]CAG2174870.1 unnamed protein product [Oppiella nova]
MNIIVANIFALLLCLNYAKTDDNLIITVRTKNGLINGRTDTFDGKHYNQFLGIPYAEPPTGDLRFKKPVPIKPWSEHLEVSQWPAPCYQSYSKNFRNTNFSEDCLYLNVWAPVDTNAEVVDRDQPKAVMVWIHGGALIVGSTVENYYSGHVLATKGDVVVVTIGYRNCT